MSTDYNLRAAKGQAFNLAVHDAIACGKAGEREYIFSKYLEYYELGQLIQNSDLETMAEALK